MIRALRTAAAFVSVICIAIPARADRGDWPSGRSAHAMAYHDGLKAVVMYGGLTRDAADADVLWAWDGSVWTPMAKGGPGARAHFAFAYDAAHDQVIVQGGYHATGRVIDRRFGDTWVWGKKGWRRIGGIGPGVRDHHAMVYDRARGQVVLFGGGDSTSTLACDTWVWNGDTWALRAAGGPLPRSTHRMVYDARTRRVLLFGGWSDEGLLNDTWAWDGTRWNCIDTTGPPPRFATRWAYDVARGEAVLFGGRGGDGDLGDTWILAGGAWRAAPVITGPSPRNVHAMAYDARRERVVLFGGFHQPDVYDDLWEWDGSAWKQIHKPATKERKK